MNIRAAKTLFYITLLFSFLSGSNLSAMETDDQAELQPCSLTGKFFGKEAENYTIGRKPYPKAVFTWIKEVASPGQFLDLGCGNGRATLALVDFVAASQLTGYDFDSDMIAEAKKRASLEGHNIAFIQGEVKDLTKNFPSKSYSTITAFTAFHWFSTPEDIQAIRSVIDPQGVFIAIKNEDSGIAETFNKECKQIVANQVGRKMDRQKPDPKTALEYNGLFKVIDIKDFPVVEEYTTNEFLADIKSHSFYTELSPEEQKQVWPKLEEYALSKIQDGKISLIRNYRAVLAKPL
jgi:ubiquinone/menaquinone biosynthesis C-methylase UbiE